MHPIIGIQVRLGSGMPLLESNTAQLEQQYDRGRLALYIYIPGDGELKYPPFRIITSVIGILVSSQIADRLLAHLDYVSTTNRDISL